MYCFSELQILEITLLIADYMNALAQNGASSGGSLSRNMQPDILKATPDHQLHRNDSQIKKRIDS